MKWGSIYKVLIRDVTWNRDFIRRIFMMVFHFLVCLENSCFVCKECNSYVSRPCIALCFSSECYFSGPGQVGWLHLISVPLMYKVNLLCPCIHTVTMCPCPPLPPRTAYNSKKREQNTPEDVVVASVTVFWSLTLPTLRWLWKLRVLVLKSRHTGSGWDCHPSRNQVGEKPRKKQSIGKGKGVCWGMCWVSFHSGAPLSTFQPGSIPSFGSSRQEPHLVQKTLINTHNPDYSKFFPRTMSWTTFYTWWSLHQWCGETIPIDDAKGKTRINKIQRKKKRC